MPSRSDLDEHMPMRPVGFGPRSLWSCFATVLDHLPEHAAGLLPQEWFAASATGTPEQCAAAVRGQLALGCDGVILHGCSPAELEPVVQAYRAAA